MFSLFCRASKDPEEEGNNMIEYLEKKSPTFDTLETEGTEESVDKNGDASCCESLLHKTTTTLPGDSTDTYHKRKQKQMNEEVTTREGGDVREAVPAALSYDDLKHGPGLAPDFSVTECVEGPDIPKPIEDKRKLDTVKLPTGTAGLLKTSDLSGASEHLSSAIVLCEANDDLGDSQAGQDAGIVSVEEAGDPGVETDRRGVGVPSNEDNSSDTAILDGATFLAADAECVVAEYEKPTTEESHEPSQTLREPHTDESTIGYEGSDVALMQEMVHDTELSSSSEGVDNSLTLKPPMQSTRGENDTAPVLVEFGSVQSLAETNTESAAFPDTIAPQLFLPTLNHIDGTNVQVDTETSSRTKKDNYKDSCRMKKLDSDVTDDETGSDSLDDSERSVRFAEPLVTSSWDVPRIHSDDLEELFYTAMDISKFRKQQKGGAPARPYDKQHCERLVEDLDRFGAESFVAGDYQKALGAFSHSLQVKTQIMTDCDNGSIATTIHCIADVYSKKGKWIQALDAFNAALELLEKADDSEEVRRSRVALDQKIHIIRRLLGLNRKPSC